MDFIKKEKAVRQCSACGVRLDSRNQSALYRLKCRRHDGTHNPKKSKWDWFVKVIWN